MKLLTTLGAAALALIITIPAAAEPTPFDDAVAKTPEQLMTDIEKQHPVIYFVLAGKLYDAGRKDEATFWLYVGQLRFSFHLEAHPELDPTEDRAVFTAVTQQIGGTINIWAFGDVPKFEKILADVLAWDEKTPNEFTSKPDFVEQWQKKRKGLEELSKYLHDNQEQIRKQRAAKGWENRS